MSETTFKNKTIITNTLFLYIRMILLMFISFYSSRVLLQKLGVEDFGIYNVVGGVVASFSSLRGVFASSTQRFFNIALGANDSSKLHKIFNISLFIHIFICAVFLLLAETIGLWFLQNEINIPQERLKAALIVYHFSIATSLITIMNVPFNALIIAYERMKFYSYISLLEGIMKLLILYLLIISNWDKLILYACLLFCISIIISIIYICYCRLKIGHYKIKICRDKSLLKEMSIFSGWNFFGNVAYTLVNEGINFLLNIFGGVILNAARGVAYQVRNAIMQFQSNLLVAIQPQAIQSYASNDTNRFFEIIFVSSKYLYYLFLCLALPTYIWIEDILKFWLGIVPDYSIAFIRCILFYLLIRSFHGPLDIYFKAVGRLKAYQMTELITLSTPILLSYLLLKLNFPYYCAFLSMGLMEVVNWTLILRLIKKDRMDFVSMYWKKVIYPSIAVSGVIFLLIEIQLNTIHTNFIIEMFITITLIICTVFCVGIETKERLFLKKITRINFLQRK